MEFGDFTQAAKRLHSGWPCILEYCKRYYFRGINFSRLAAQKHIRGLLNSRWADAHLSWLYCTKLTSFNEWYIYKYVCNWAAQTQSRSQTDSSILPICINTHGQYTTPTCPKCAYKISQIFRGFLNSRLLKFARNSRKLMYREYFRFYSSCIKALGLPIKNAQVQSVSGSEYKIKQNSTS